MEPERRINLVRNYGTPASRLTHIDVGLIPNKSFFTERRLTKINLLFFGTVFETEYLISYAQPNEEIREDHIIRVNIFRPGKWVDRLEKAVERAEKQNYDRRFSPVKGW